MKQSKKILILVLLLLAAGLGAFVLLRGPSASSADPRGEAGHVHGEGEHEGGDKPVSEEAGGHNDHDDHDDHGGHGSEGEQSLSVSDSALRASGVTYGRVEKRTMALRLPVLGKIALNGNRTAHLHARFSGMIVEVNKQLGERVRKGDVLARIESNESLEAYTLRAPRDGVVIGRHATVGESVTPERELFMVSDLSVVWVDFQVYRQDFSSLRPGQRVRVTAEGTAPVEARLNYLAPSVEGHSQALLARAELPNPNGAWTPGLFVQGEIATQEFSVLAVRREAVQEFEGGTVVFVRETSGLHTAHPITIGRRDGDWIEVIKGPYEGEAYVVENSYLLKAEFGKGEASHDH
jgi:membrane fusion protein, heavy metal efflux system